MDLPPVPPLTRRLALEFEPEPRGQARLLDGEEDLVKPGMSASRVRDLCQGREAAHRALAQLGAPPTAVGAGRFGEPLWPDGFVGSISHSGGVAVSIAGPSSHYDALGIDLELRERVPSERFQTMVLTGHEWDWIGPPGTTRDLMTLVLFSAKETLYKAMAPSAPTGLTFHDVEIVASPRPDHLTARPTVRQRWPTTWPEEVTLTWRAGREAILTVMVLARRDARATTKRTRHRTSANLRT